MPASLRYEELVQKNVVGPGQSGGSWAGWGAGPAPNWWPLVLPQELFVTTSKQDVFITTSRQELVQETELKQHIRGWEDAIQTLLQEQVRWAGWGPWWRMASPAACLGPARDRPLPLQEEHVPFDIHTYGDQVVSRFSQLNQWCPFAKLVAGQPAFEVCRSMLASLQLVSSLGVWEGSGPGPLLTLCALQANDYTVEITQQPGLEAAVDTMSLRLLTHQRAHKRFQTYAAPSTVQP